MSYRCPYCRALSSNPADEEAQYCGRCHQFDSDFALDSAEDLLDLLHKRTESLRATYEQLEIARAEIQAFKTEAGNLVPKMMDSAIASAQKAYTAGFGDARKMAAQKMRDNFQHLWALLGIKLARQIEELIP